MKNKILFLMFVFASVYSATIIEGYTATKEASGQDSTQIMKFIIYTYEDPMARMEAFRMLIPEGWRAQGSITWSSNPALPVQSHFSFRDPSSLSELDIFPSQSYFWTNNQIFLSTNPPGTLRFGTPVARPVDLSSAFNRIIIPNFRSDVRSLRIVRQENVPELAQLAKGQSTPGVISRAEGGKVRIEYLENGRHMEEEIYAAVSQFITHQPGSFLSPAHFINYWYIDYIFSFKAEKGALDNQARLFQPMIYSFKVSPKYFAKIVNVKETLAQLAIQNILATGRMGDIIAKAGSDIRADQQKAWEQRQQVQERIAQNFSDYVRGVERFHDPFAGKEVELPAGYGHAWANNLGEYIVTESPSYNPNIGSNHNWESLKLAR